MEGRGEEKEVEYLKTERDEAVAGVIAEFKRWWD